jgi:hypothetical protein
LKTIEEVSQCSKAAESRGKMVFREGGIEKIMNSLSPKNSWPLTAFPPPEI